MRSLAPKIWPHFAILALACGLLWRHDRVLDFLGLFQTSGLSSAGESRDTAQRVLSSFREAQGGHLPEILTPRRLLVVSPHSGDTLRSAGLIQKTLHASGNVRVLTLSDGDGKIRRETEIASFRNLGVSGPQGSFEFFGLPERRLSALHQGEEGASKLIERLALEIVRFRPDMLVLSHPNEANLDHMASYFLSTQAIERAGEIPVQEDWSIGQLQVYVPLDTYAVAVGDRLDPERRWVPEEAQLPSPTTWYNLELDPGFTRQKIEIAKTYGAPTKWQRILTWDWHEAPLGRVGRNEIFGTVEGATYDESFRLGLRARILRERGFPSLGSLFARAFGW